MGERGRIGSNWGLRLAAALGLLLLLFVDRASAQTFNAGARSLGLGGSFQALADDVTAVFWNPAGTADLGIQAHATFGSYQRIDENGDRDTEPVPGPAFIGLSYGLDDQTAIIGGYFTPFVNERRYLSRGDLPPRLSFRDLRVEQFFNRLSIGAARRFVFSDSTEGWFSALAIGGTLDLSISDANGDYFDSEGVTDKLSSRDFAPGFSLGVLGSIYDSPSFELKLGATYHHPGDFKLSGQGFAPLAEDATASRLYDWPMLAGAGLAFRLLKEKPLVLVFDYQYVAWNRASRFLEDAHNFSLGVEYAFAVSEHLQIVLRSGGRRLEEPSARDPLSKNIPDHSLTATFGGGLVYQPRVDAYYAASTAFELGQGLNFVVSFTIGF